MIERHPDDSVALSDGEETLTYGALRSRVAGLRGGLARLGAGPGERVALAQANSCWFVASYLAVLGTGAVAVPLNPTDPSRALERELSSADPALVLADSRAAPALGLITDWAGSGRIVGRGGGGGSLEEMAGAQPIATLDRLPEDTAVLLPTAGTAGEPKLAALSHGNLASNLDQTQRHPGGALRSDDVVYGVVPMFHILGLNVVLGLCLHAGATLVLADRFDAEEALSVLSRRQVTVLAGAPPMFDALTRVPVVRGDELRRLRRAVSGASPLPEELARRFQEVFGVELWQGYGLTEASPTVTSSFLDGRPRPGSIGVPLPGVELRLVDEEGQDALEGDPGEIWVRGPNVFLGYWRDQPATAAVLSPEGWLRTGDVAVADGEGHLYLVDRAKDLIIVSGFNVYPAEVERALRDHPGVAEAAVVGVADQATGEAVKAFVVVSPGSSPTEDDLIGHVGTHLAGYKCPRSITFVDQLPRGLTGKLRRRDLRRADLG